jgi:predicted HAD superfamily Cof-like phosphohydrolase
LTPKHGYRILDVGSHSFGINIMNKLELVRVFQSTYKQNVGTSPSFPNQHERDLRVRLLEEEWKEYLEAEQTDDYVEVCDAMADMLYIIYGTCVSYGIPINEIFQHVHDSNMSKLDENGQPIFREDGKVLKGANFWRPDIKSIIDKHK